MKRQHILAFVLAAVLTLSGLAVGAANNQTVEAVLVNDITFNVDGKAWSPRDVDGSLLTPLIYNGRTYVPVRSLLEDKGVTVGFDDKTRTVVLDYSTFIDKTSPVTIKTTGGAGKASFSDISFMRNKNFVPSNIKMEQEYTFELTDSTVITADGKAVSLAEVQKTKWTGELENARFVLDEKTGAVKSVTITTPDGSGGEQLKVTITVEISYPPFRIKITIRW